MDSLISICFGASAVFCLVVVGVFLERGDLGNAVAASIGAFFAACLARAAYFED